jgi:hypothetical protein
MNLTLADWLAVASIALPLIAKAFTDWQANAVANHNASLARIVGMAGRQAATIARELAALPPGADARTVESTLIRGASESILTEMGSSSKTVGADAAKVAGIVQGELNKVVTAPVVLPPAALEATPIVTKE